MHTATALEYHLRRLDGDALAAFVADLWAARGFETDREDDVVVATHGDGEVRIRIPRAAGRKRGSTDGSADVVVALDGGSYGDARVVDAPTLREMLTYAVDRETTRQLCERHLGAAPAELRPGPVTRARRGWGRVLDGPAPSLLLGTVAVVFVLGVVAWVGASPLAADADTPPAEGVASLSIPGQVTADSGLQTEETQANTREEPFPSSSTTPPPGVNDSGVTDVDALARAHERVMSSRSHTVWLDYDGAENGTANGAPAYREMEMAAEGDRYLITTTVAGPDGREQRSTVYHDGTVPYGAIWNESTGQYDRVFEIDPRHDLSPTPRTVRETVVERYLSTPQRSVTGKASLDGSTAYRVVGRGPPDSSAFENVEYYRVVALVDARGFVHDVTVEYLRTTGDDANWIREEVTYGRVGTTTVQTPEWYERHVENGTAD